LNYIFNNRSNSTNHPPKSPAIAYMLKKSDRKSKIVLGSINENEKDEELVNEFNIEDDD